MKSTKLLLALFLLFTCLSCAKVDADNSSKIDLRENVQTPPVSKNAEDCVTMNFHYLITLDFKPVANTQQIEVFLDEKAFNEENLKTLFSYLSDKNTEPKDLPNGSNLIIIVKTNWQQLDLPSDCLPSGSSGEKGKTDTNNYHFARFYRRGENSYFGYNATLNTSKLKDVIMKGDKIFRNGQWQKLQN